MSDELQKMIDYLNKLAEDIDEKAAESQQEKWKHQLEQDRLSELTNKAYMARNYIEDLKDFFVVREEV